MRAVNQRIAIERLNLRSMEGHSLQLAADVKNLRCSSVRLPGVRRRQLQLIRDVRHAHMLNTTKGCHMPHFA